MLYLPPVLPPRAQSLVSQQTTTPVLNQHKELSTIGTQGKSQHGTTNRNLHATCNGTEERMTEHPTEHLNDDGVTRDDVKYSVLTSVGVVGMMAGLVVSLSGPDGWFLPSMGWTVVGLLMILVSSHVAIHSVAKLGADR